jgi:hypothetical protein
MHFYLRTQGPADACGSKCQTWISASGSISAETPRDFEMFAKGHDLSGSTLVIDSDGGSVLGAIALGRDIRRLNLDTAVGRVVDLNAAEQDTRAKFSPIADCESMCGFVLLGGVHRTVPPQARVMVHQIWLGDRRDDPTAANYSAEDLVLVQRDIGRLAQYTIEMGGSIELLDLALRIPPWEPMHALSADETRRTHLATELPPAPVAVTAAAPPVAAPVAKPQVPRVTDGAQATEISERRWAVVDHAGVASLARRQPLTLEGEEIGSFDLLLACGAGPNSYDLSYIEHRQEGDHRPLPDALTTITMRLVGGAASLKVVSSERRKAPDELVTYASGTVSAALIDTFAAGGNHSMLIETQSAGMVTGIRLGNTGAQQNLPRLAASCVKPVGDRAEMPPVKIGGMASAK